jgi:hypothetical protein
MMAKSKENKSKSEKENPQISDPMDAPIIYSYIYEREPSDLEKLYKSHHNQKAAKDVEPILGFEFVNGELIPKSKK